VNFQHQLSWANAQWAGLPLKWKRGSTPVYRSEEAIMNRPNLVLEEALRIAELGYKVLPCSQDKKPILKGWPEKATTDAQQIKFWFSNTDYLLAVKTGPETNLFVLDVDPDGMDWLKENQDQMLCERVHETRRGGHYLYGFLML
tara:strand:+ start:262 stop:693 length:432 start_codon:yes stop_codon:yes gene_type:complete